MSYTIIKKDMIKTLEVINEINQKFPMLTLNDINFKELNKTIGVSKRNFLTMIVFMDYLHKQSVYVDINEVNKMIVDKKNKKWHFRVSSKKHKDILKFEHNFNLE